MYFLLRSKEILTLIDLVLSPTHPLSAFAVVKENYAFDKDKKELFISAKVAKALNLKPGSLAQVN